RQWRGALGPRKCQPMAASAATAGTFPVGDDRIAAVWRAEEMPASGVKRVGVIGAGMVGVCAASWLQRDGHEVFLVEAGEPGRGALFGHAGGLNGSEVTQMPCPG